MTKGLFALCIIAAIVAQGGSAALWMVTYKTEGHPLFAFGAVLLAALSMGMIAAISPLAP